MFNFINKMNIFKKMGEELSKQRKIDVSVEKTLKSVKSGYKIVPSMEIKAWKAYMAVTFAAGFCAALIWSAFISVYPTSVANENPQVTLSAQASAASHKSGEGFPVEIILNTAGKNIVAIQVVFTYDKNTLELLSIDTAGSDFNFEINKSIDASAGQGSLSLARSTPGVNSQMSKVAIANFRALADAKEPTLKLKFESQAAVSDSAAILDDGLGTNVLQKLAYFFPSEIDDPVQKQSDFEFSSITGLSDMAVMLFWTEGPEKEENYIIERKESKKKESTFLTVGQAGSNDRQYVDRSIKANTVYNWRVCQNTSSEKICTGERALRTLKKKKIATPNLSAAIENGKVKLTWNPTYISDFGVFIQKRIGKQKKFSTISVINSDSINSYLDETVASGEVLTYRILVAAKKKSTQKSKSVKISVP